MPTRQDVAIGLSLATLWFIGVWSDLLPFLYLSSRFPVGRCRAGRTSSRSC